MLDFFKVLPNFDDPDEDEYSVSRKMCPDRPCNYMWSGKNVEAPISGLAVHFFSVFFNAQRRILTHISLVATVIALYRDGNAGIRA